MDTAKRIREYEMSFAEELRRYGLALSERYAMDRDAARSEARDALIRTGVLNKDGSQKERIVSWG